MDLGKRNTNSEETTKIANAPRRAWKDEPHAAAGWIILADILGLIFLVGLIALLAAK